MLSFMCILRVRECPFIWFSSYTTKNGNLVSSEDYGGADQKVNRDSVQELWLYYLKSKGWAKMKIERCVKESFVVIGKEGSTTDGAGFIQKLWDDANSHFGEVQHLAKKDEDGNISGIWGAMTDFSRSFHPWENFSNGLYLAGVECNDDAEAPDGWTKWVIPGYEYIYAERENDNSFPEVIKYLEENDITLAGAVHDFTCPKTGKGYMFFPIRKL